MIQKTIRKSLFYFFPSLTTILIYSMVYQPDREVLALAATALLTSVFMLEIYMTVFWKTISGLANH